MDIRKRITDEAAKIWKKRENVYTSLIFCGVILIAVLMYIRVFCGTELTDEAYYVSEAKEMLNGNIPFSYNNSSKALGFAFLLVAIEAVYKLFAPDFTGVFLVTRLCFVTYKVVVCYVVYRVLQRKTKKSHALLLIGMILPTDGYLQNFSYNTVPMFTLLMAGCFLYDVIEQDTACKNLKLIVAGFGTGIACFANPGWAVALLVFLAIIVIRTTKKEKIRTIVLFLGAVFAEVLLVIVPIVIQTSFAELWYGFYRLFINPIPVDSLNPNKTWTGIMDSFKWPVELWIKNFLLIFIFTYVFVKKYRSKKEGKLSRRQYLILSVTAALFVHLLYLAYVDRGKDVSSSWSFVAFCYMVCFAFIGAYKKERIVWYLGIYPVLYTVAEIILVSNGATIGRFENCFTILLPMLYVLLKNEEKLIRLVATIIAVVLTFSLVYVDFHRVYRDEKLYELNYKVKCGVYKGIYTTEARSRDLPELEEYLNHVIGENETYAFRDNVPSAYLMVHTGKMCDISTWDVMQYTYHRNAPAVMFDYYRRRDSIPDKIIYVDYGRDKRLSVMDPKYRYNDWVKKYYDLVEDIRLNETYSHVMVYQYNGTFDGDYQYWIDTYWELVK